MKLLDTTFLIHYWKGDTTAMEYLSTHEDAEFVTTTLNIKELAVGRALQDTLDPHEIKATFEWLSLVPFEYTHAIAASEIEATLYQQVPQQQIRNLTADILIGGVAKECNATVVTENTDDFELLPGVTVESYR